MTEEIIRGINLILWKTFGSEPEVTFREDAVSREILEFLHSKGLVVKVEEEL